MRTDAGRSRRVIKRVLGACAFVAILVSAGCTTQNSAGGAPQPPTITTTTANLAQADATVAYSASVTASGGTAPFTWIIVAGGPAWLSTAASTTSTVMIQGTPPAAGPAAFSIKVTDANGLTNTASLSITVNAPPTITTTSALLAAGNVGTSYSSTVNETGGTAPFSWTILAGGPAWLGAAASTTSAVTIQGIPTASGAAIPFSIKVTDAAGGTNTANLTLNIGPAPTLSITTTTVPNGSIGIPYAGATIAAMGGLAPYTWSNPTGSLLSAGFALNANTGAISGTPTTTNGGPPISADILVTDSQAIPATAPATFNITVDVASPNACGTPGGANKGLLKGEYAFYVQGYHGSATPPTPIALAASFNADGNGGVTAGEEDSTDPTILPAGSSHVTINATGSSYVVGADNRGCITLVDSGSVIRTFRFTLGGVSAGVASTGRIIEFDSADGTGNIASGILRLQTPGDFVASNLHANYAFGLDGLVMAGGHYAVGGSFSLSTAGAISSLFSDFDDGVNTSPVLTGDSGGSGSLTLPISTTTGRVLGSISDNAGHTYSLAIYVINANQFFAITTDLLSATQPILSGRIIVTGASGSFSNASAAAASPYMIHVNGTSGAGGSSGTIGILTLATGTPNTVSGNLYQSDGTTQSTTGTTYTVSSPSGRVALTQPSGTPPALYIATPTDGISAFIIGLDTSASFGYAEAQGAVAALSGLYTVGIDQMIDNAVLNQSGVENIASGVVNTGKLDYSDTTGLVINGPVGGTFTIDSTGFGTCNVFGSANTHVVTNGTELFLLDDTSTLGEIIVFEK